VFERFTDRARRVVVLAQEEARLLRHNYIGTEHLLLGLIREGEGVAAKVLESMDISLAATRQRVEEIIGHEGQGNLPSGHIPFTPRAKKVLELSLREAMQLGHNYIGTEHILLGLIREGEGVAAQALRELGADLTTVRQAVVQALSGYDPWSTRMPRRAQMGTTMGPRPAECGFCGRPSPECGTLYSGSSRALICEQCLTRGAGVVSSRASTRGTMQPQPSLEELAAEHIPTGPPPDDEEAARAAIEHAFANVAERAEDGSLVNVEDGRRLSACQDVIDSRYGAFAARTRVTVDHIVFLDATNAVVWTTTLLDGNDVGLTQSEGRAVFVDDRWKMTRDTACARWARAGVVCPPPDPSA
jgi:ATP-dependent Clp protease ATP-binding subunit ClpA